MFKCEALLPSPCVFFLRALVSVAALVILSLPACRGGHRLATQSALAVVGGLPPPCTQHPGVGGMYAGGDRGHAPFTLTSALHPPFIKRPNNNNTSGSFRQ